MKAVVVRKAVFCSVAMLFNSCKFLLFTLLQNRTRAWTNFF